MSTKELVKKKLEELKEKYGRLYQITTTTVGTDGEDVEHEFKFKEPQARSYDRFLKNASKKANQAMKNLLMDGVIDEDKDRLKAFFDQYPAGAAPLAQHYLRLMGHSEDANLTVL